MAHVSKKTVTAPEKYSSDIEQYLDGCKKKFNQILFGVLNEGNQDAHNPSLRKNTNKQHFLRIFYGTTKYYPNKINILPNKFAQFLNVVP